MKAIYLFPAVLLCSCSSPKQSDKPTEKKDSIAVKPSYDTVTTFLELALGDTAIFKAPNNKCYLIYGEAEPVDSSSSNRKSLTASDGNVSCDGNKFDGSDRKKAKISVVTSPAKTFKNLSGLLSYLGSAQLKDDKIASKITSTGEESGRVKDEKLKVTVEKAWLYTFTRQADEDYHLIIGTTDDQETATFFNVEISGLPATTSADYDAIKHARDQFFAFFKWKANDCKMKSYTKVYMGTPIEVGITGSLFFDKFHYQQHGDVGPGFARGKTYWEIHPITSIDFH